MVVWSTIEATCPICGNRLRLREVGSGFCVGQDSDLFVRMRGKHIIQAEVHTCHHCRYSGYSSDFFRELSETMRTGFLTETAPGLLDENETKKTPPAIPPKKKQRAGSRPRRSRAKLKRCKTTPLPHVQYEWSAKTAEAIGLPSHEQARRLLRAYWCLRIAPSANLDEKLLKKLRKRCLTAAIRKFRQGLRYQKDSNLVFLVAELCRRNGNFSLATRYFRRFLEREEHGAEYLTQAADKLCLAAQEKIEVELSMEEVLYNPAPDDEGITG